MFGHVRCDFYVEGSEKRWVEYVDVQPAIGDRIEHDGESYLVVDVAGEIADDLLATVKLWSLEIERQP
jgi:hypothetical protein